jgi:hypothetical protein
MAKSKVTQAELKQAKNLRVYSERTATMRVKYLRRPYTKLASAIKNKYNKSDDKDLSKFIEEEIKNTFGPAMEQQLLFVWKLNIDQFVDYFVDKFKRNIVTDKIDVVKSKLLKEFSSKYMAKKITSISETTESILNTRIAKYTEEGLSFRDMVNKIVEDTGGEISRTRAKLIASEETSQAISVTNHKTAQEAKLKYKKWIHRGGAKVDRPNHLAMDGVIVGINQKFNVPGHESCPPTKMRFPKDPENGVACQIIRCFCGVVYTRTK